MRVMKNPGKTPSARTPRNKSQSVAVRAFEGALNAGPVAAGAFVPTGTATLIKIDMPHGLVLGDVIEVRNVYGRKITPASQVSVEREQRIANLLNLASQCAQVNVAHAAVQ